MEPAIPIVISCAVAASMPSITSVAANNPGRTKRGMGFPREVALVGRCALIFLNVGVSPSSPSPRAGRRDLLPARPALLFSSQTPPAGSLGERASPGPTSALDQLRCRLGL